MEAIAARRKDDILGEIAMVVEYGGRRKRGTEEERDGGRREDVRSESEE